VQLARLEETTAAPVSSLPYLFVPEVGVAEIGALAGMVEH